MINEKFYIDLLDSLKNPVLFIDTDHVVRYLNKAAGQFYSGGPGLLGRSLFNCHREETADQIRQLVEQMKQGLEEKLIISNDERRVYIRAVRDETGGLLGYYERFEPALGK